MTPPGRDRLHWSEQKEAEDNGRPGYIYLRNSNNFAVEKLEGGGKVATTVSPERQGVRVAAK